MTRTGFITVAGLLPALLLGVAGTPVLASDEADAPSAADVERLRQQNRQRPEFELSADAAVRVDAGVLERPWHPVPFDPAPFTYSPVQIEENWAKLSRAWQVPWPSAERLRTLYRRYPALQDRHPGFTGDHAALSREVVEVWRLYFRGDFQSARRAGDNAGFAGLFPGLLAQVMSALYLEPSLERKHMLLQDVAANIAVHADVLAAMKKDEQFRQDYALMRLLYVYAIGRIGEDVPVPEALRRGYAFKVLDGVDDFATLLPEHPLTPALQAGVDANIVRKLGKAMGRITFGARQSQVREGFERTLARIPDSAVIRYEYANALLFIDRKRGLELALSELQRAAAQKPYSALEALDAMYAAKRRRELQSLLDSGSSFRAFERERNRRQQKSGVNPYCIACPPFLMAVPEKAAGAGSP